MSSTVKNWWAWPVPRGHRGAGVFAEHMVRRSLPLEAISPIKGEHSG
jgi:hypothetical protein